MMSGWVSRPTVTTAGHTAKFISNIIGIAIPPDYLPNSTTSEVSAVRFLPIAFSSAAFDELY